VFLAEHTGSIVRFPSNAYNMTQMASSCNLSRMLGRLNLCLIFGLILTIIELAKL
jgi:hypothetical protein